MGSTSFRDARRLETIYIGQLQDTEGHTITRDGLENLVGLPRLKRVIYQDMKNADEKLKVISRIPALEDLVIERSDISNKSAKYLSSIEKLRYLDINGANIDSTFFKECRLPNSLTHLRLDNTQVDSSVIKDLPQSITHLSLQSTKIDKRVIPELANRKGLKFLKVSGFSQASLDVIRAANPDIKINPEGFSSF
ncbi:hypothetical protein GC197_06590 [bacterium]|nr:hypothetical protein [bacterium]